MCLHLPAYILDGKQYKTVSGLFRALIDKHNATDISAIRKDRSLSVYEECTEVARYHVSAPEPGKDIELAIIPEVAP